MLKELEQFEAQLKKHDWWYEMSDDGRVYDKGRAGEVGVNRTLSQLDQVVSRDELKVVWERIAPKEFPFPLKDE